MTNTLSHNAKGASTRWWLGPVTGAFVSATVTVIVVIWEWIENPGGIFRSELETNWQFISDTAISWFVPTFVYVAVIVSVSQLAWHFVKKYRGR
jgi:hypothetical protein